MVDAVGAGAAKIVVDVVGVAAGVVVAGAMAANPTESEVRQMLLKAPAV